MNLLQQLANFCHTPVSINLVDPPAPQPESQANSRPSRSLSVFALVKGQDTRQTRSIEKIQAWAPSTQKQTQHKVLFKMSRMLSNKIRKNYFNFWVVCEQIAKDSQQRRPQSILQGSEKVEAFLTASHNKYAQQKGLPEGFKLISRWAKTVNFVSKLKQLVDPLVLQRASSFLRGMKQSQTDGLKLQLFLASIQINFIDKVRKVSFQAIVKASKQISNKRNFKASTPEFQQHTSNNDICVSKIQDMSKNQAASSKNRQQPEGNNQISAVLRRATLNVGKLKAPMIKAGTQDCAFHLQEAAETQLKVLPRAHIDKVVQNSSEICDNNLIFLERPLLFQSHDCPAHKQPSFQANTQREALTRRSTLRTISQLQQVAGSNHEVSLQNQCTTKRQYTTPKSKTLCGSSAFNIDEARIEKLEKRIFGELGNRRQNRFSVNGEDWKNDRETLKQIMDCIKSPVRNRRSSACELNLHQLMDKVDKLEKENAHQKQKEEQARVYQTPHENKKRKSILINSLLSRQSTQHKAKSDAKILVSLKSKRRDSAQVPAAGNSSKQWRKLYLRDQQSKKLYTGSDKKTFY